jgi:hypothetical protein
MTRRLFSMIAALAAAFVPRDAVSTKDVPKDDGPSIYPVRRLSRHLSGLERPFAGGYKRGSFHPVTPRRYMKPEQTWERDEIAAHAKSECRRLRDERNEWLRLRGIDRKRQLSAIRADRLKRLAAEAPS